MAHPTPVVGLAVWGPGKGGRSALTQAQPLAEGLWSLWSALPEVLGWIIGGSGDSDRQALVS